MIHNFSILNRARKETKKDTSPRLCSNCDSDRKGKSVIRTADGYWFCNEECMDKQRELVKHRRPVHYLSSVSLPHQWIALCGRLETDRGPTERERRRFAAEREKVTCKYCLRNLRSWRR